MAYLRWGECRAKRGMCTRPEAPRKVCISEGSRIDASSTGTSLNDVCERVCVYAHVCVFAHIHILSQSLFLTLSLARALARSLAC
jgi:hypothetical protein